MLGLYVHIPFCSAICNYCNFNRGLFDATSRRRYLGALLTEIGRQGGRVAGGYDLLRGWHAVAAGALRGAEHHRGLPRRRSHWRRLLKITLEANPETVTRDRLRAFREAGVNRLSFGVQSFRDEELQRLSRLHSAARAREAFEMARDAGLRQRLAGSDDVAAAADRSQQWLSSVDALIALGPDHASLVPAGDLSERAAQGCDGAFAVVAGARR